MSDDNKLIVTPEEAEALLKPGEYVHNFINPSDSLLVGCDYDRDNAVKALKEADRLEIGGENCKRMKHALVAWKGNRPSFFECDMEKVEALEAERAALKVQS